MTEPNRLSFSYKLPINLNDLLRQRLESLGG